MDHLRHDILEPITVDTRVESPRGITAVTFEGERFFLDATVKDYESDLSPVDFTRINRQMIVQFSAIKDVARGGGRHSVRVKPDDARVPVSRNRLAAFESWLDR